MFSKLHSLLRYQKCYSSFRPHLFNSGLRQIPTVLSTLNYRMCPSPGNEPPGSCIRVVYKPYKQVTYRDHDHKNMTLRRPMSPHLSIYAPNLASTTSILQRATGIGLAMLAVMFAGSTLFSPKGVDSVVSFIQSFEMPVNLIIINKTLIAFVFTYHFFMGIRFIFFWAGMGLDIKTAYTTAILAIVMAGISAVLCGLIGHAYRFDNKEIS